MIVKKVNGGYSTHRKYIQGQGYSEFIDANAVKPIFNYISQNKDPLAKPLLGAAAAFGFSETGKALLTKIMNRNPNTKLTAKGEEILNNITGAPAGAPVGAGIKKF